MSQHAHIMLYQQQAEHACPPHTRTLQKVRSTANRAAVARQAGTPGSAVPTFWAQRRHPVTRQTAAQHVQHAAACRLQSTTVQQEAPNPHQAPAYAGPELVRSRQRRVLSHLQQVSRATSGSISRTWRMPHAACRMPMMSLACMHGGTSECRSTGGSCQAQNHATGIHAALVSH